METKQTIKVGDVIEYSWGYDQTNVQFFKAVKTTPKTVWLVELKSKTTESKPQSMTGHVMPEGNMEEGAEVFSKRIQHYENRISLRFEHGVGNKWDGNPQACSWYA